MFYSCINEANTSTQASLPVWRAVKNEQDLVIETTLPGVPKDQIKVSLENGTLSIEAERPRPEGNFIAGSKAPASYRLKLKVAPDYAESNPSASYENGILTLRLPQRAESQRRLIPVL
jgi:HSP20 family protein